MRLPAVSPTATIRLLETAGFQAGGHLGQMACFANASGERRIDEPTTVAFDHFNAGHVGAQGNLLRLWADQPPIDGNCLYRIPGISHWEPTLLQCTKIYGDG